MNNLHAIILAGGTDFGRCAIGSKVPACLWPVLGRPAIVRVLDWLATNGISSATICFNGEIAMLQGEIARHNPAIVPDYIKETMPWGTAGCTREAIRQHGSQADNYLICKSNMLTPPPLADLIEYHNEIGDIITLSVNIASSLKYDTYEATGIYLCKPELLEQIPRLGYCDIKERLIPCLVQKDIEINSFFLQQHIGSYRNIKTYYKANCMLLSNGQLTGHIPETFARLENNVYAAPNAKIDPTARLFGPLVIMDNVEIAAGAVIFGPGIIGENTVICPDSFLEACQIWPGAIIGSRSEIRHSFINGHTKLSSRTKRTKEVVY